MARELEEELGVEDAEIGAEIFRTRHAYEEMPEAIELIFFAVKAPLRAVRNNEFETIEWRAPEELLGLDFLAADREFVRKLARREIG